MGARDRYTSNVECPKCKQKGVLHIAEDEYRYSPLRREIEQIEGNFSVTLDGAQINKKCEDCGEEF
jgi:hypothetical protein